MNPTDILARAAERLATVAPYALPQVVTDTVHELDPTASCVLWLCDYRLAELRPVDSGPRALDGTDPDPRDASAGDGSGLGLDHSDAGRCVAGQVTVRPTGDAALAWLPVSARGDRLGALLVRSASLLDPAHPGPGAADTGVGDRPEPPAPARRAQVAAALDLLERLAVLLGPALLSADVVTDRYRRARRGRSLTLAAELQWERLPGRSLDAGYVSVAAQLEPAYSVVGDAYDWVADPDGLQALIVDGAGYGGKATANADFTLAAVRNARREGAGLSDATRLADQALFARTTGESFASAVLAEVTPESGTAQVLLAGSGTVVLAGRHHSAALDLERHPPLGTEEDYPYRAQAVEVAPGDRLVLVSDGLTDARRGERLFGEGLARLVHDYRLLGSAELVRAIVRDLGTFHAGERQADDAVVLCLEVARTGSR